ncbi:unnamed protein product [Absidia cylindrospora]
MNKEIFHTGDLSQVYGRKIDLILKWRLIKCQGGYFRQRMEKQVNQHPPAIEESTLEHFQSPQPQQQVWSELHHLSEILDTCTFYDLLIMVLGLPCPFNNTIKHMKETNGKGRLFGH